MERTFRKLIEGIKKLKFIFVFLIPGYVFSQDINLFEEIEGINLRERKTEIFEIIPYFQRSFPLPEMPEITLKEETNKETLISPLITQIEEIKEKEKVHFFFEFGSFSTLNFGMNYEDGKFGIGFKNLFTKNYRENSEMEKFSFFSTLSDLKNNFNLNFSTGKNELPGPIENPFDIEREWNFFNLSFSHRFEKFKLSLSDKFYAIEKENTHFFSLNIEFPFKNMKIMTDIEEQIFNQNTFSFSQRIIFEREKFLINGGIKFIERNGIRFLPGFIYRINENFKFFLNSEYENPDLWKDVISNNWNEIKDGKLKAEEIYKFGFDLSLKETSFEISHSYNKRYLWEDIDGNSLYEPYREKFEKTSIFLNSKIPVSQKVKLFLNLEKDFFDKEITYLPEETFEGGIEFKNKNLSFKIFNSYKGERNFKSKKLDGYSTLNFEINYKKNFEVGLAIYNILDKKFEIVPEYPGEKRKIIFYLRF